MSCHRQGRLARGGERSDAFMISLSRYEMENDVMRCSRNGAKVVVKSCKPVHISDIASKLLTGQGLING